MFHPLFDAAAPSFRAFATDHEIPAVEPLTVSPWVAMSALQKGIRRADVGLARRATASLLEADPIKLWRRLAGIAVEDIGLGDLECVAVVMAATSGKTFRLQFGGEWAVASKLVERMCLSAKCRAADDLFITVSYHHELEALRGDLAGEDLTQHLRRIADRSAALGCALAALHASGVRWTGHIGGKATNPRATFDAMRAAGIEHGVVALAEQSFRRTREALPVLLPLLTPALPTGQLPVADDELPPVVLGRNGVPTYCLDGFSHEGKGALGRFLKRDTETGRWSHRYVPAERRMAVLAGGVFVAEGSLCRQRVEWPCAATLRWLASSGYHGIKLSDPAAFLAMVRADLPALDEVRHDVR